MGEIDWVLVWIGIYHHVWFSRRKRNLLLWCWLVWKKFSSVSLMRTSWEGRGQGEGGKKVETVVGAVLVEVSWDIEV